MQYNICKCVDILALLANYSTYFFQLDYVHTQVTRQIHLDVYLISGTHRQTQHISVCVEATREGAITYSKGVLFPHLHILQYTVTLYWHADQPHNTVYGALAHNRE